MQYTVDIYSFSELSTTQLYAILALRSEVFVVEQRSPYQDLDGLDQQARHLCLGDKRRLIGYIRLLPPGVKFQEASMGRIIVAPHYRGDGLGKKLIARGVDAIYQLYGSVAIRIEAQSHLMGLYSGFGFVAASDSYDWGGITHLEMVLLA